MVKSVYWRLALDSNTSYVEHKYYIYETEIIFFVNDDVVDDLFGF